MYNSNSPNRGRTRERKPEQPNPRNGREFRKDLPGANKRRKPGAFATPLTGGAHRP